MLPETALRAAFVAPEPLLERRARRAATTAASTAASLESNDVSRCCSFLVCLLVDPESRLRVEEMQRARVDRHLDRPALVDVRARPEAADEQRVRRLEPLAVRAPTRCASSSVSSVVGARCAPSTVKCTISSEPSASRSSTRAAQPPVGRRVGRERGLLEVLRAGCRGSPAGPRRTASAGRVGAASSSSSSFWSPPSDGRGRRSRARRVASSMFIAGEPMKPPTKRLTGRS